MSTPETDPVADALKIQRDASSVGFDWSHLDELWPKLAEEIGELREAVGDRQAWLENAATSEADRAQVDMRVLDEFGDLLFMAMNLSRHLKIDPAQALAHANEKFRRRFAVVQAGRAEWDALTGPARIERMEALWQQAKRSGL